VRDHERDIRNIQGIVHRSIQGTTRRVRSIQGMVRRVRS
jgi:hypothetical protein